MNGARIKFYGLDRQYQTLKPELLDMIDKVYSSGNVLNGIYTERFEEAIAWRTNRKYAIAVNSCSQALMFAYVYYKKYPAQSKVALPALSCKSTLNAPKLAGFDIHYIDVDENGLMDLDLLNIKDDNIGIISYVNLYGNVIDYNKLAVISSFFSDRVPIIEDAAQSFGASYNGIPSGKLGHISCLSFGPTKNLPNYGSGGMILTDDPVVNSFCSAFRNNGSSSSRNFPLEYGTISKMSDSDSAEMIIKLSYFDMWQRRRTAIAEYYTQELSGYVNCPTPNEGVVHAWSKYVIKTVDQRPLIEYLDRYGIDTEIHYESTIAALNYYGGSAGLAMGEELTTRSVSLPIYPELTDAEVECVAKTVSKFYDKFLI